MPPEVAGFVDTGILPESDSHLFLPDQAIALCPDFGFPAPGGDPPAIHDAEFGLTSRSWSNGDCDDRGDPILALQDSVSADEDQGFSGGEGGT